MTADPVAETPRTLVRDWRPEEADRFFDIYRRWEVSRWLGSAPAAMQHRHEADARIARWGELNAADRSQGRWAVERKDDGVVVGTVLLVHLPDGDGELEVGWHLHPDSWGRGYASEAAGAVMDRAFAAGVEEVFAVVRPDNTASLAVCRRLGMAPLGRTTRYYQAELELFRAAPGVPEQAARNR
ncbi:MAG: GNAT family N-acetyltransferase [Nocardioides sp.]